jgi:hypothetical protein
MEILYPMFYGTRLVTFDVLRNTFEPHMHPEAARRGFAFILYKGGKFGIGGGYRPPGNQPIKNGFAPPGRSFHEGQLFPSGRFYTAWDMVVVNPGGRHRSPKWSEVPAQGQSDAVNYGVHMNVSTEAWHMQPIELDGYDSWVNAGRYDLVFDRPIRFNPPQPPVLQPPVLQPPVPSTQPPSQGVIVEFASRVMALGSTGNDVKFYQNILNDISGQGLTLDGHLGAKTVASIKAWQSFLNLEVTGALDAPTQRSMIEMSLLV